MEEVHQLGSKHLNPRCPRGTPYIDTVSPSPIFVKLEEPSTPMCIDWAPSAPWSFAPPLFWRVSQNLQPLQPSCAIHIHWGCKFDRAEIMVFTKLVTFHVITYWNYDFHILCGTVGAFWSVGFWTFHNFTQCMFNHHVEWSGNSSDVVWNKCCCKQIHHWPLQWCRAPPSVIFKWEMSQYIAMSKTWQNPAKWSRFKAPVLHDHGFLEITCSDFTCTGVIWVRLKMRDSHIY